MFLKNQIRNLNNYAITIYDDSFLTPKTIPLIPGEIYNVTYVTDNTKIKDSFKEENHILTKQTITAKFVSYSGNTEFLQKWKFNHINVIDLDMYCSGYLKFDMSTTNNSNIIDINACLIRDIGRYIKLSDSVVITPDNSFETLIDRIESYLLENINESLDDDPIHIHVLACREIIDLITPIKYDSVKIIDRDNPEIASYSNIGIVNQLATNIREYDITIGDTDNNSNDKIHKYSLITTDGLGVDENIDIIITNQDESKLLHLLYSISKLEIVGTPFDKKVIEEEPLPENPDSEDVPLEKE